MNIYLTKWINIIKHKKSVDEIKLKEDNGINEKKEEIIKYPEKIFNEKIIEDIENNKEKKCFFEDDINDDEKKVILDDMLVRFRLLLMSYFLQNNQNLSDSYEILPKNKISN